jgi:L-lactate utilization protein LutC
LGLWKKLFGSDKNTPEPRGNSPYLPEKKEEIEVVFAENFTRKGGKFIYSEDVKSTNNFLKLILEENHWTVQDILCFDPHNSQRFGLESLPNSFDPQNYKVLIMGCEYLIANKGTVLICHHQLKDFKLETLPDFFIVYSGLGNFVNDVSEGMSQLKKKYGIQLPTNITTLNVRNSKDENDFLSYGNSAKNLYLIIQEE